MVVCNIFTSYSIQLKAFIQLKSKEQPSGGGVGESSLDS